MKKWHKIAEGRCDMLSESWNPGVFGDGSVPDSC